MSSSQLALVISTIGRPTELRRLLTSIEASPVAPDVQVVVVDQSDDQSCAAVVAERDWTMDTLATTSGRGAAVGRNAGLKFVDAPVVGFPDDNCWYQPSTLTQVLDHFAAHPDIAGLSGRQCTVDGRDSMLRWRSSPGRVTRTNFLRTSIMSTMFFRTPALEAVGPFDEMMGVGSAGWYGAGEESDLLLRVVEHVGPVDYVPTISVLQDDPRDHDDPRFVEKMLRYGCGMGHLWRVRRLSRAQLLYYGVLKVAGATVRLGRGQPNVAKADITYLRGLVAGYIDRPPKAYRRAA